MIPNNITKEHIYKAIVEIKQKGVPPHRVAARFFLNYEGEQYPPKYVLSIANKYANGSELNSTDFSGGLETNDFLRKLGFSVDEESTAFQSNIWVEKSYWKSRRAKAYKLTGDLALGKALISPQRNKSGGDIYRNMRLAKTGDIILHLVDNEEIVGISKVKSTIQDNPDFVYLKEFFNDPAISENRPGYKITLDGLLQFKAPVPKKDILNEKNKEALVEIAKREGNVFYDSKLDLREGAYLTAVPKQLLVIINKAYREKNESDLPYIQTTAIANTAISKSQPNPLSDLLKNKKQIILYGPPGTGKTFQATRTASIFLKQQEYN